MKDPRTFEEFWPSYVLAHAQPLTRILHSIGTLAGWGLLVAAILLRKPWLVLAALVTPYALAWFSHFFVEHNRPASFWPSFVVVAGGSEDGGDGAGGKDERGSAALR